jgi:hypothetical protein
MATKTKTKTRPKMASAVRRIALTELSCDNFKGLKHYRVIFDGHNATVQAENGVGKTTLYDLFLWVFFGKDSTGRKEFGVRPIDADPESPSYGEPVKGLVLAGQVGLRIDGEEHIFRKEHHEKVVKGQLRGYETLCWIDEVPKKVSEYQECISGILPEDTFRILTDLAHFTTKMHWTDRRTVLLDVAGEAGTPEGFDALLAVLNGRTVKEYEDVLRERKKRYAKDRDEINPRIDELQRNLTNGESEPELTTKRNLVRGTMDEIEAERQSLLAEEKGRQDRLAKVNGLTQKKLRRNVELENDTSALRELLDEKAKLQTEQAEQRQALAALDGEIRQVKVSVESAENEIQQSMLTRKSLQDEYKQASEKPVTATCYACGQNLPADKLKDAEVKRKAKLAEVVKRGNEIQRAIDGRKEGLAELQQDLKELQGKQKALAAELGDAVLASNNRIIEINETIKSRPQPDPTKDKKWQEIAAEIERAEAAIGEPVSEQLEALEGRRKAASAELEELNKALAQVDRSRQDKARITELADREKELAQLIADTEGELAEIDRYKVAQSELIEANVNDLFQHVEFKMFNVQLNEGIKETCEATYNGVPFADLSTGQQILCGVDIVNVLSCYFGISAPLFIDHSESITIAVKAVAQTIKLYAVPGVKTLQVKVEEKEKVVA